MNNREHCDNCERILRRDGNYRIIERLYPQQWIIQRRTRSESPDGARWEAVYFCTSRAGLLIDYPALAGVSPQELMVLPEHITWASRSGCNDSALDRADGPPDLHEDHFPQRDGQLTLDFGTQ